MLYIIGTDYNNFIFSKKMLYKELYIYRFDDMCPTMNWTIWDKLEVIFDKYNVKPTLAVIPACADKSLWYEKDNPEFWIRVRGWQDKGYDLALHGFSHVYTNKKSGILGITRQSEFAGVNVDIQRNKIEEGLKILKEHGIRTNLWIAPSHSFDKKTLAILKENGISVISDGFSEYPFKWKSFLWIPCQIWDKIKIMDNPGIYTICIHHSNWTDVDVANFESDVVKNKESITSLSKVVSMYNDCSVMSLPLSHRKEVIKRKLKNCIKNIIGR